MAFVIGISPAIFMSSIFRIAILSKMCLRTKLLRIMLAALALYHARSIWEFIIARTMHHALCDSGIKHGMHNRVRDLSRNNGVDMSGIINLERPSHKEEMNVWQVTLLKLKGENKAKDTTKHTILYVFDHGLHLLNKDTCNDVRMIRGSLSFARVIKIIVIIISEQILLNL